MVRECRVKVAKDGQEARVSTEWEKRVEPLRQDLPWATLKWDHAATRLRWRLEHSVLDRPNNWIRRVQQEVCVLDT